MKISENLIGIVIISAAFILIGIGLGSDMQEAETKNVLKDLGYRLEHHHYEVDNVSSNWYELVRIKDVKKDGGDK